MEWFPFSSLKSIKLKDRFLLSPLKIASSLVSDQLKGQSFPFCNEKDAIVF